MISAAQRGVNGLRPPTASPATGRAGHVSARAITAAPARFTSSIEKVRQRRRSAQALIGLDIAALFVDLNGFTQLCTREPVEQVFKLVREFRRRITGCVVRHGGCVNRHFGDGAMASFGVPVSNGKDAACALRCAHAMLRQIRDLDIKHRIMGRPPVSITIGLQWGHVVMGNVGTGQYPDIVPLGDSVNVASRLESLGHGLGATIVAGEDLVEQVRRELGMNPPELEHFECLGPQPIRGRNAPVTVWTLPTRPRQDMRLFRGTAFPVPPL